MRWIIGDIHGMLRPLEALVGAVTRRDPDARLIFVGDYVNRGGNSRGVIDLLLALKEKNDGRAAFLRGNHDDVFDLILHSQCYICLQDTPDAVSAFAWFMQHGLADTLESYGLDWAELDHLFHHPSPEGIRKAADRVPPAHREFIRELRPVIEYDDIFVTHGYWDIDTPDTSPGIAERLAHAPSLRHRLLWGRYSEAQLKHKKRWLRTGYFGHTPVSNYRAGADNVPIRTRQMVLLDTGVALGAGGRLSAVCADAEAVIQAERSGKILEAP